MSVRPFVTYPSTELDLGEHPSLGFLDAFDLRLLSLGEFGAVLGFNIGIRVLLGDDGLTTTDDSGRLFFGFRHV